MKDTGESSGVGIYLGNLETQALDTGKISKT
jgi:hypothetical protein